MPKGAFFLLSIIGCTFPSPKQATQLGMQKEDEKQEKKKLV